MEISYDIIIKYLSKNDKKIFSNKKHILCYSEKFPELFSNLLQTNFYKYGITTLDQHNTNISFFMSLLTLINNKFLTFTNEEELVYMNKFKVSLKENSTKYSLTLNNYLNKNKLDKKDIINDIKLNIQLICETLNCIFIIFDFKNLKIKIAYPDDICNPWKPILLLANYDDMWEPIMYDSKRTFSYNESTIKKIINETNLEYYEGELLNKSYIVNSNIKEIIDYEQNNLNKTILSDSNDTFVKKEVVLIDDEIKKLNKLTKTELTDICNSKNIKVTSKLLKKEIIDLIINNK